MILKLNHLREETAATTQEVTAALYSMVEEGQIPRDQFSRLRVHLDWIQYRQNFRDVVMAAPVDPEPGEQTAPFIDVFVDTRQVLPGSTDLRGAILSAIAHATSCTSPLSPGCDRLLLEEFTSFRTSIAWSFNSLYWRRLDEW